MVVRTRAHRQRRRCRNHLPIAPPFRWVAARREAGTRLIGEGPADEAIRPADLLIGRHTDWRWSTTRSSVSTRLSTVDIRPEAARVPLA